MPKVSVIVPVYEVEKYIERCARSLFEQTLDDIEYIFVDDCTQDCSMEILCALIEEYQPRFAEMNYSVRIERMPSNSGLSAVRRHGIQIAKGDYIIHCDSDDWVDRDMYRLMYGKAIADNSDMVISDFITHDGVKQIARNSGCNRCDSVQLIRDMLFQKISWSVWNKMVRRELYSKVQLFPAAAMGEDMVLILQLTNLSIAISYINSPLYYYYSNPNSITRQQSADIVINRCNQYLDNIRIVESFFSKIQKSDSYSDEINWLHYSAKSMLYSTDSNVRANRKDLFPSVEYKVLFFPDISTKLRLRIIINIIGSWLHIL